MLLIQSALERRFAVGRSKNLWVCSRFIILRTVFNYEQAFAGCFVSEFELRWRENPM